MQNQNLDIMQLGRYVTEESESGRITQQLLADGNELFEPDSEKLGFLRRYSPSGNIDLGLMIDGKFVVTHVISDSRG
jgi:hypothetical protein